MLKTIREIGIFMIAAQAVVHFAPGRQYERYIKSISGVIILLLFLKPFLRLAGGEGENPSVILEKMGDMEDIIDVPAFPEGVGADSAVVRQMEAEVKSFLNREWEEETYCVRRVSIRLAESDASAYDARIAGVEITVGKREEEKSRIVVEEIVIGDAPDSVKEETFQAYRQRFAELLEIPEENVEVKLDGRG